MENEQYTYTKEDVITTPMTMNCSVSNIRILKGEQIFVNKEGVVKTDKPNEDFIVLTLENANHSYKKEHNLKKYNPKSVPDQSSLGKYLVRYGKLETGQEVVVAKNTKGYYDLIL